MMKLEKGRPHNLSATDHGLLSSYREPVEIHALPDNGLLYYRGFHVNLAAGLEDSLVATLKPVWNMAGV